MALDPPYSRYYSMADANPFSISPVISRCVIRKVEFVAFELLYRDSNTTWWQVRLLLFSKRGPFESVQLYMVSDIFRTEYDKWVFNPGRYTQDAPLDFNRRTNPTKLNFFFSTIPLATSNAQFSGFNSKMAHTDVSF